MVMGSVNELMTELADAVRLKSGETGDMTIKQMVIAMAGITVADDLGFTCGSFTATSTGSARTITHGLGHTPGAIVFFKKGTTSSSSTVGITLYDCLVSIVYGDDLGYCYCYATYRKATSSSSPTQVRYWTHSTAIPSTVFGEDQTTANYYPTSINATTFTTPRCLVANQKYFWIAFRAPLA